MAIVLSDILTGYNVSKINDNFTKIENELNTNVLRRNGLGVGEDNKMSNTLDMNGFDILNAKLDGFDLNTITDIIVRSVRVDPSEGPLSELPSINTRKGKLLGFNPVTGQPDVFVPSGGSAADVLFTLAEPTGASLIGYSGQTVASALDNSVEKSGDTMTGPLVLSGPATLDTEAATLGQVKEFGGGYVTQVLWHHNRAFTPSGTLTGDGQEVSRALYPSVYAAIVAGQVPVVADATWLSDPTKRGCYTLGNGTTTMRLPDYNGISAGSLGAVFQRGDGALSSGTAGTIQQDALQNIVGTFTQDGFKGATQSTGTGAISALSGGTRQVGSQTHSGSNTAIINFNASFVARTSTETRPTNITGCYIIRMAGAAINAGNVDALALATEISNLTVRVVALENRHYPLFTTLYPNGTEAVPANISINQRLSVVNPYAGIGRKVDSLVEVLLSGNWGPTGWLFALGIGATGVSSGTLTDASIIIQSGTVGIITGSSSQGNPHGYTGTQLTSLPFRLKVWTID